MRLAGVPMKEITHELKIKNKSRFRQRSACWKTIHDESKFKKLFVLMKQTNDYLRKQNHEDEKGEFHFIQIKKPKSTDFVKIPLIPL